MSFRPASRYVGENWNNRDLVVVVPEKKRIMPQKDKAKSENGDTDEDRADKISFLPKGRRLAEWSSACCHETLL
jgi:hypothetical protein